MHLLRLVQSQVRLGEPLPWGVRDEHGKLLLARGHVITSEEQLAALLARGASVDIEEVRAAASQAEASKRRPVSLFGQWEQVLWQLDRALRSVAEAGFEQRLEAVREQVEALTLRDPDIAIWLTVRQDPKRLSIYALAHSVHCALVGLLMARRLGWDEARTHTLMRAALSMNIAILDLQGRMAEQRDPPSKGQMDQIRAHPHRAAELLAAAGVADEGWLQAVRDHHERVQGGYPRGSLEPGDLARLVRAADVWSAKISPRALRSPLTPQAAARHLFQEDGGGPLAATPVRP